MGPGVGGPGLTPLSNTWTENGKMFRKEGGMDAGKTKQQTRTPWDKVSVFIR